MNEQKELQEVFNIFNVVKDKQYLPEDPSPNDLLPFLFNKMKSKRLRKKYLKNYTRYWEKLPKFIFNEYLSKTIGKVMAKQVYDVLNQESFMRRILTVTPINNEEQN